MKRTKTALVLAGMMALPISQAFAQSPSAGHSGFNVNAGMSVVWTSVDSDFTYHGSTSTGPYSSTLKDTTILPRLGGEYMWAASDRFLLGVGGNYQFGTQKTDNAGTAAGCTNFNPSSRSFPCNYKFQEDHHWSAYVKPTYAASENTAVYAKISYNWMKAKATDVSAIFGGSVQSASFSSNQYTGWGFGLGANYNLTKNVFVSGELMRINYGSESESNRRTPNSVPRSISGNPTNTEATLSVGYKF